jgi:hypothetical protein
MTSISTVLRQGFELQDLPTRAISLDEDTLSQIFGGCKKTGEECSPAKNDCCDAKQCKESPPRGYRYFCL